MAHQATTPPAAQAIAPVPHIQAIVQSCKDLLDEKQAANVLDVSPGTLAVWRSTGRYKLPFLKVGRNVRYRRTDLESWLQERCRSTGATA